MPDPLWKRDPEEHDYPAARDFLDLLVPPDEVERLVKRLKRAETTAKKAKDILRAAGVPLLNPDNPHVRHNLDKVRAREKLSPILLVRGQPLIIADGYHRVCSIYYLSEDLEVPCRIA